MRLIDADALKLEIVEAGQRSRRYKVGEFWESNRDEIWNVIDAQPTIKPERKKGKWDKVEYLVFCSECGWIKHIKEEREYNYCPNCGAKMDEVEDVR